MKNFQLSQNSLNKLVGVKPALVEVVKRAIELTVVDFGVCEGVRTPERQLELYNKGASQISRGGKHVEHEAVDLMAYIDGRVSWELNLYDNIADAMKKAAIEKGVAIRWGAAWNVPDIREWPGTMEEAMNHYIDERRKFNKRPFIDGPHFEMV